MRFSPFTDKDFDAYLQRKWESNVFNRERLEVKQKLLALGRLVAPQLQASDGSPLECEVSVEHPALWNQRRVQNQHLFFSRNKEARQELDTIISKKRSMAALIEDPSPLRNHLFLSVMIDAQQLELGLKLHSDAAVDRENLERKCQEFFSREKLLGLIRALPQGFEVGILGHPLQPTHQLDDDALTGLVQAVPGAGSWLVIRESYPRDCDIVRTEAFADLVIQRLICLLPLMHFVAWSRDNDFVSMREILREKRIKTQARGLSRNDVIRVVQGVFTGKTGVVQDIEAKGKIRVRLGKMLVQLGSSDVEKL